MNETLKIVIPMAGFGTRLRPQTWSRPKQLISMAGKTVIEHVLDMFSTLPETMDVEYVFIVGYLGEKIQDFMANNYPDLTIHYVEQKEMRGQSHAIYLAEEYIEGPMLMVFADTLIETDLNFLEEEEADVVAWVKPVPDPRRFGVAELGEDGLVTRLIEKPKAMDNNLAVVGFYYFREGRELVEAIEKQMERDIQLKGEYFLADAINIMLDENQSQMRTEKINIWLDAGTPDAVLETNRYLLDHGYDNSRQAANRMGVRIIPPVYIHPEAVVEASVLGPHTAVEAGCEVRGSVVQNTILEEGARVEHVILQDSLVGQKAAVEGGSQSVNVGDDSILRM